MTETAVVALGSNMGDRELFLQKAVDLLQRPGEIRIEALSSIYETPPLDVPTDQADYLNQVVVVSTTLAAVELLKRCQEIERQLGRPADHATGMPRVIDLDLITHGSMVSDGEDLMLPHPRYSRRKFVLVPLAEVMPAFHDPVTGEPIAEMVAACPDTSGIQRYKVLQEERC